MPSEREVADAVPVEVVLADRTVSAAFDMVATRHSRQVPLSRTMNDAPIYSSPFGPIASRLMECRATERAGHELARRSGRAWPAAAGDGLDRAVGEDLTHPRVAVVSQIYGARSTPRCGRRPAARRRPPVRCFPRSPPCRSQRRRRTALPGVGEHLVATRVQDGERPVRRNSKGVRLVGYDLMADREDGRGGQDRPGQRQAPRRDVAAAGGLGVLDVGCGEGNGRDLARQERLEHDRGWHLQSRARLGARRCRPDRRRCRVAGGACPGVAVAVPLLRAPVAAPGAAERGRKLGQS